jgi:hypothetical protein
MSMAQSIWIHAVVATILISFGIATQDPNDTSTMVMVSMEVGPSELTHKEGWESYSFMDVYDLLDCRDHAHDTKKPLYSPDMWAILKGKYASQLGIDLSLFPSHEERGINYYADYAEGKGRGIFAARDFLEGELVQDGSLGTAFWNNGMLWKEYVMSLPPPMPCDVMEWTWIQQVGDKGWFLCLDFGASLMNHDDDFNTAPSDKRSLQFYAVRGKFCL